MLGVLFSPKIYKVGYEDNTDDKLINLSKFTVRKWQEFF